MTDDRRKTIDNAFRSLDPKGKSTEDIIQYIQDKSGATRAQVTFYLNEGGARE